MQNKNKYVKIFSYRRVFMVKLILLLVFSFASVQIISETIKYTAKKSNRKRKQTFRLDFNKAKMDEFLKTMSELLQRNIIIDGKVPGNVTIVSPKPIPLSNAYMVLKTVLAQYGYMPIEDHDVIRIIRIAEAIKMDNELRVTSELAKFQKEDFNRESKNVTHIVILQYAKARELTSVLRNVATKETKLVSYDKANALVIVGNSLEILHLVDVVHELDKRSKVGDLETARNIHIYHLENADADKLAPVLARLRFEMPKPPPGQPNARSQKGKKKRKPVRRRSTSRKEKDNAVKVDVIANKETNSLIITANAAVYREVKRIIVELDIVRRQVLVEALIVEISGDGAWGAGIEWRNGSEINDKALIPYFRKDKFEGARFLGGSSTGLGAEWSTLPGLSLGILKNLVVGPEGTTQIPDVYAFLNLFSREQEVNILSTPQIMVTDNQEAEINVGQQVPVVGNMRTTGTDSIIRSYDLTPVGIKLKITPHINKNKYISLEIYQEVKSLIGDITNLAEVPPIISNRDIKTQVTIKDRHTLIIGGLIQTEKSEIERKTPILGDIPILGWFFKRTTRSQRKTNLLVFITPYLISDTEDAREVTRQKRVELEKIRSLYDWKIKE